jgi:pentatricopeptide repeat protein
MAPTIVNSLHYASSVLKVLDLLAEEQPNAALTIGVIEAASKCFRKSGDCRLSIELFYLLQKKGMAVNASTCVNTIEACRSEGLIQEAWHIFEAMKHAEIATTKAYNAMIGMLNALGDANTVISLFREMVVLRKDRIKPCQKTYCLVFPMCKDWQQLVVVVNEMKRSGLDPSAEMYTSLIVACEKLGRYDEAIGLFKEMKEARLEPSTTTFTVLISICSKREQNTHAAALFHEMKEAGLTPSLHTYNALMCANANALQVRDAMDAFRDIRSSGLRPDVVAYNSIMMACTKSGDVDGALRFFRQMKSEGMVPGPDTYRILLPACRNAGNKDREVGVLQNEMRDAIRHTKSLVENGRREAVQHKISTL